MSDGSVPAPVPGGRILQQVGVPMRDGVSLPATVYLPEGQGPFPTVLVRTAYNRLGLRVPALTERGMALVVQDCRGRYGAGGEYYPFVNEPADGGDTLDWLLAQPWCNGKVGMFGDSYLAATQFLLAPEAGEGLHALVPRFMAGDCWKRAYYCDGAFSLALTWSWLCFECAGRVSHAALMPLFDLPALLRHLPLLTLDVASGAGVVPAYRDYVQHNAYDAHWEAINIRPRLGRFRAPTLLVGGWYDNYAAETVANYAALRAQAPTAALRDSHRMLIGPWTHGLNPTTILGEVDFGPAALAENEATYRWLDCLLHGGDPASFQRAPVRYFVMGLNEWRDAQEWPPPGTRHVPLYLDAGGRLCPGCPGRGTSDGYVYDPASPAPTLGGNHSVGPYNPGLYDFVKPGPYDQRPVEARDDVLTYTTAPLAQDMEVTGPVSVRLYASSSAPDTDFVARLTDVLPDGRSINITEGVIRARFRQGVWGRPRLLAPGEVYPYTIDLQVTGNLFRRGHCLRLQITSSNFPLWDRNLNTGEDPATSTTMRPAEQRIYHGGERPSHLLLPVAQSTA